MEVTAFLQNFSQIHKNGSFAVTNLFVYTVPIGIKTQTVEFNTCTRTARWYNMQESPEYLAGVRCGVYPDSTTVIFTINSFVINGIQQITIPLSASVDTLNANWIPANNNIVLPCTGTTTGWTYTDFVDFLNETFCNLGVDYRAQISTIEVDLDSNSKSGFYLIYPENDVFYLNTSSNSGFPFLSLIYANSELLGPGAFQYYKMTNNVTYYCDTDTIVE
jgi:hypothetical protein